MKISSIRQNSIPFKSEKKQKVKNRWAKAFASTAIPGLGQFCDGRNKAGAFFLIGTMVAGLGKAMCDDDPYSLENQLIEGVKAQKSIKTIEQELEYAKRIAKKKEIYSIMAPILAVTLIALKIASVIDAFTGKLENKYTKQ